MKQVLSILFLVLLCLPTYSQVCNESEQKLERVEIFFDLSSCFVDPSIEGNRESIERLGSLLDQLQRDSLVTISEIRINSFASPVGGYHSNEKITQNRTNAIYDYLTQTTSVPDSIISKKHSGIDWKRLTTCVEESDMHYRDEVLYILNNIPEETWRRVKPSDKWQTLVDSRIKHLMDLESGHPYHYIAENFFPQLRRGSVVVVYFRAAQPSINEPEVAFEPTIEELNQSEPTSAPIPTVEDKQVQEESQVKFAVKTNLLYDMFLMPNVELEIPIYQRFSVTGELVFPWWVTNDNGYALQMLSGQVEGRYWFGDRELKPQLTGWFAGLYAGGGLYDLQWRDNGYQGEFYIAAGLSGGYAHTINKSGSLRMEYSLGLGYLNTEYRYYEGMQDNKYLVWQHDGRYTWIGPTKAKVSLVWLIDWQRGDKR